MSYRRFLASTRDTGAAAAGAAFASTPAAAAASERSSVDIAGDLEEVECREIMEPNVILG